MNSLSPAERAEAAVCAELLAIAPYWWAAGMVFSALTAVTGLVAGPAALIFWPVSMLALSLASTWAVSRVVIDVGLFRAMAHVAGPFANLQALDTALMSLLPVRLSHPAGERTVGDRVRGAFRWWLVVVFMVLCQACGWLVMCWQIVRGS